MSDIIDTWLLFELPEHLIVGSRASRMRKLVSAFCFDWIGLRTGILARWHRSETGCLNSRSIPVPVTGSIFLQSGSELIVLLCGGDKSTQGKDIAAAKKLADTWKLDQRKEGGHD